MNEVNRLKIIQDVIDRRLTTRLAAERLGISDRQCRRLLQRYREDGPLGMTDRRRGKPSNYQLPAGIAELAIQIIRERYADFGPTLACEKLAELHNVVLAKETVRKLMIFARLWIPRKQRAPKFSSHVIAAPASASLSRLMVAIIAGLKNAVRPARCWFMWMTQPVDSCSCTS